ncbi:MAG: DUF1329 domain-containing protein [Burkholderiales bacterium]|nr:DUF1329 domain-containing protein [Burkholderiales bacterium]
MLGISGLSAGAGDANADKLGSTLTPLGGDRSASTDVPAWEGASKPAAGWTPGKPREASWNHKDEKPLYSIDAGSADKHASQLTPGQMHLLKHSAGYRMDVYPSHRNCTAPDFVIENTKRNAAGAAKLSADGDTLLQAALPGVPFPVPTAGVQAIWNFQLRYGGVGADYQNAVTLVSPRTGSNTWITVEAPQHQYFPWGAKGTHSPADTGDLLFATYYAIRSPAALAGQALVAKVSFGSHDAEVNYYFPGQRRVRRMPAYGYDSPQIGYENQYTIDQTQMFTGNVDRFDWKLVGKKEILVPYNTFRQLDFDARREDVYGATAINPAYRRYELHRVWVVEATVKKGMRHLAPRKVFYFDEDSWQILVGEDYDGQGNLWKVREASLLPAWELGSACESSTFVQYDVLQNRYLVDFTVVGTGKDVRWLMETNDKRFTNDFFTADNLRSISER